MSIAANKYQRIRAIPDGASLRWLCAMLLTVGTAANVPADEESGQPSTAFGVPTVSNRPAVPGKFLVSLRSRKEADPGSGEFSEIVDEEEWETAETAIIICDMWDDHYCKSAAQRVDVMAPRMNRVVTAARNHGAVIVHAPSGTMDQYQDTPYRLRMQQAPAIQPPVPIAGWCYLDPEVEPELPVDVSSSPCDDPVVGEAVRVFTRQHPAIHISGFDGVSDNGQEIYNFFRLLGIKNVVVMGVHTNMCVLGRSFGIRQLKRLGMNVVLARDLTDAMYDPREYPYVSHTRGTELVVEHIETYWCPSMLGRDLMHVIPGSNDPLPETIQAKPNKQAAGEK